MKIKYSLEFCEEVEYDSSGATKLYLDSENYADPQRFIELFEDCYAPLCPDIITDFDDPLPVKELWSYDARPIFEHKSGSNPYIADCRYRYKSTSILVQIGELDEDGDFIGDPESFGITRACAVEKLEKNAISSSTCVHEWISSPADGKLAEEILEKYKAARAEHMDFYSGGDVE